MNLIVYALEEKYAISISSPAVRQEHLLVTLQQATILVVFEFKCLSHLRICEWISVCVCLCVCVCGWVFAVELWSTNVPELMSHGQKKCS